MQEIAIEGTTKEGPKAILTMFSAYCKGCGLCIEACNFKALDWSDTLGVFGTSMPLPDMEKCTGCGICVMQCPDCAIIVEKKK
ncbi:MAG: 4Fe-4S binding protein [Firmicutes bacterium]|nr:4Fe-4S binding protein [Bacillota bacterium]